MLGIDRADDGASALHREISTYSQIKMDGDAPVSEDQFGSGRHNEFAFKFIVGLWGLQEKPTVSDGGRVESTHCGHQSIGGLNVNRVSEGGCGGFVHRFA
jgi:hypothetical protein